MAKRWKGQERGGGNPNKLEAPAKGEKPCDQLGARLSPISVARSTAQQSHQLMRPGRLFPSPVLCIGSCYLHRDPESVGAAQRVQAHPRPEVGALAHRDVPTPCQTQQDPWSVPSPSRGLFNPGK